MVQPDAVLEVSDGILRSRRGGDDRPRGPSNSPSRSALTVIAVGGEEGQLGTGRGLHTPDCQWRRDIGPLGNLWIYLGVNRLVACIHDKSELGAYRGAAAVRRTWSTAVV